MFFILLGIAAFFGICWLIVHFDWNENAFYVAVIVGIALILVGIFAPVGGYKESTKTIELISLNDGVASTGNGGMFYVSISVDNHYTYYTEVDSKYAEGSAKAYKSYVVAGNVTVVEDDSYTDAKLVIHTFKPKMTFWSF
jgi:hypothetical protein